MYLTCTAVAKPTTINYQIYLNDAVVHNSTNGTMVINPVMNYHEGNYICVPINTVGADGNASLLLNVSGMEWLLILLCLFRVYYNLFIYFIESFGRFKLSILCKKLKMEIFL